MRQNNHEIPKNYDIISSKNWKFIQKLYPKDSEKIPQKYGITSIKNTQSLV